MIDVEVEPDRADGYVLRVLDGDNRDVLLSSTSQSYANADFAERLAKRLFASAEVWSKVVGIDPPFTRSEPFGLLIRYRDGESKAEIIRGDDQDDVQLGAEIEPDNADGYTLRIRGYENGNILLSSTAQSYSNAYFAERLAHRLFGLAAFGPDGGPEPVRLTVTYRDGTTRTETIR